MHLEYQEIAMNNEIISRRWGKPQVFVY